MIYLYSIIEGLFFTDFFSHSQLRFNQLSKYYLLFFYKKQKKYQYCDDGSIGIFNLILLP